MSCQKVPNNVKCMTNSKCGRNVSFWQQQVDRDILGMRDILILEHSKNNKIIIAFVFQQKKLGISVLSNSSTVNL